MKRSNVLVLAATLVSAAIARAQPPPVEVPPPGAGSGSGSGSGSASDGKGSGSAAQIGSNGTPTDAPLTMPPDGLLMPKNSCVSTLGAPSRHALAPGAGVATQAVHVNTINKTARGRSMSLS